MKRSDIVEIQFHNPHLEHVGIEVLTLAELRARAPKTLIAPQQVDFYLLMLIEAGHSEHIVDFVTYTLSPGAVMVVRPGQVQEWRMHDSLQGQLVLVSKDALAPSSISRAEIDIPLLALDDWPTLGMPSTTLFMEVLGDVARIRSDIARFVSNELGASLIRHTLFALLLRIALELQPSTIELAAYREAEIYRLFARELELGFYKRLSVLDYARRIGYAESTLSRACKATVGRTAKECIDQRIVLEAKRLLAHSQLTVAQIGYQLNFTEPTNFVKFFRRLVGIPPLVFRSSRMST